MSIPKWPRKDPGDELDYSLDFTALLEPEGDDILAVTWTVPTGLSKTNETNTSLIATVWLAGGAAGTSYTVTCSVLTVQGRTIERSAIMPLREL